jgi:rSAM/selenodomain-associated transferase 1
MATSRRVLGIFAKQPTAGEAKTRLARQTSPDWAARVARAFLDDTLDRCAGIDARRVIAFAPADGQQFFESVAAGRCAVEAQAAGDLGQRLDAFFTRHLATEARTVVIGTDSPTLPPEWIDQAFDLLDRHGVVLGPATDGGYYLIGAARRVPPIFAGIDWSTARVLAQTVEKLDGGSLALLPPWYDVDTLDAWHLLCGHVAGLRRAGVDPRVPRTEAVMRDPDSSFSVRSAPGER